jgi:hypothetical protein
MIPTRWRWAKTPLNLQVRKKTAADEYQNCFASETDGAATTSKFLMEDRLMQVHLCALCLVALGQELAPFAGITPEEVEDAVLVRQRVQLYEHHQLYRGAYPPAGAAR